MNEEIVLCAANAYEQKFYLNPEFDSLPENVKQELQIMCVLYTEDVGGVLMLVFDEEGNLELKVDHEENDFFFDEIGSVLKIRELQKTKQELFESLELFSGCSISAKKSMMESKARTVRRMIRRHLRLSVKQEENRASI